MRNRIFLLSTVLIVSLAPSVSAQPGGRMADTLGDTIVQEISATSCDDFAARIQEARSGNKGMRGRLKSMMTRNPQLRTQLVNKIAGPIVNKLIDCNLLPNF